MLYDFRLKDKKIRLWQRHGESYQHILLKALGYAMFCEEFPGLEIEKRVGLRYKPDLVAQNENDEFIFWGEAGENSIRKTAWLLKHARVEKLVLLKLGIAEEMFIKQLKDKIPERCRQNGRLTLINFSPAIVAQTADGNIENIDSNFFKETKI